MGAVPGWMLRHRIKVEPYLGESAVGAVYGPAVDDVRAFVDEEIHEVRSSTGQQVVSSSMVICLLSVDVPPQSRVTLADGRQTSVIIAKRRDGGGLPTPDHLEIHLV
jgi:hypothetical protein